MLWFIESLSGIFLQNHIDYSKTWYILAQQSGKTHVMEVGKNATEFSTEVFIF